jgi:hypothetical protein
MRTLNARHGMTVAVLAVVTSLTLVSCSSDSEPTTSASAAASASAIASSTAPSTSATASAAAVGAAAAACTAYFDLDLLNSSYAGGAVADGDLTEEQVRADFQSQLKELVAQAKAAVADGTADAKLLANAKRMKKIVKSLDDAQALSDLSKKKQTTFAKSSLRVQKACDRAGYPLPADNVTARQAAGL